MPSSRGCRSSYDCIVKIKGVTTRSILFSQLMRSDGEGAINPEELFAGDRSLASEQERVHEDELHSLMRSILDWAISFLSESSQGAIRAIYFEGKTVKQHSEEENVTVYAIYKRLARSSPSSRKSSLRSWRGSMTRRAPSSRPCSGLVAAMRSEQVKTAQGRVPFCGGNEPYVASGPNELTAAGASSRELQQDTSAVEPCARYRSIGVRVSYAGECSIEEAVSRYLAARENVRDAIDDGPA